MVTKNYASANAVQFFYDTSSKSVFVDASVATLNLAEVHCWPAQTE